MQLNISFVQGFLLAITLFSWGILLVTDFTEAFRLWVIPGVMGMFVTAWLAIETSDNPQ
jgi:hypothetical protein